MRVFVTLVAGLIFGLGLTISDMIDPARVLAFLDIGSGAWDPTLGFVMGGAMVPMAIAWVLTRKLDAPAMGESFPDMPTAGITPPLLGGATMFGAGWGLVGFCPGPALSAITIGGWPVWLFVIAMMAGNLLADAPWRRAEATA